MSLPLFGFLARLLSSGAARVSSRCLCTPLCTGPSGKQLPSVPVHPLSLFSQLARS